MAELVDHSDWTLRERTAGLMRGSREKLQLGYTAPNAAYAALRYERGFETEVAIDDPVLVDDLIPFAEGFADGMADALENFPQAQPVAAMMAEWEHVEYERHHGDGPTLDGDESRDLPQAYMEGRQQGNMEFAANLYPALTRKPEPDYIQRFPERA